MKYTIKTMWIIHRNIKYAILKLCANISGYRPSFLLQYKVVTQKALCISVAGIFLIELNIAIINHMVLS